MSITVLLIKVVLLLILSCVFGDDAAVCGGCRLLTPLIQNGDSEKARSISLVDPRLVDEVPLHTGFLTVTKKYNTSLFFWFFPSATPLASTPWVIWVQGGLNHTYMPGIANMSPIKFKNGGKAKYVNDSIGFMSSLLFVDAPAGSGFSFTNALGGYAKNKDQVIGQLMAFIHQFVIMFPELRKAPLFLAGNSFVGKYVATLALVIHKNNTKLQSGPVFVKRNSYNKHGRKRSYQSGSMETPLNLRGVIMGNAMLDLTSTSAYSQLTSILGILDDNKVETLAQYDTVLRMYLEDGKYENAGKHFNETLSFIEREAMVSKFDHTKSVNVLPTLPEFELFIDREDVKKSIGIGNVFFNSNQDKVIKQMLTDYMKPIQKTVEQLLLSYAVMCYNAQNDLIAPYGLARNVYKTLQWPEKKLYEKFNRLQVMDAANNIVAYEQSGGRFTEVMVRNTGHTFSDNTTLVTVLYYNFIKRNL